MADATSLAPAGWEVHVGFRLFLLDHNNDNYLVFQAFNNPENGYVADDTCVLGEEVYVRHEKFQGRQDCLPVVKDPISYKYTWKINKFSALTADCLDSNTFMVAEHKWKIQVYPKGKGSGTGNHLSIYLALAEPTSLSQGSQIYADFTMRILDRVNAQHYLGKGTKQQSRTLKVNDVKMLKRLMDHYYVIIMHTTFGCSQLLVQWITDGLRMAKIYINWVFQFARSWLSGHGHLCYRG
ncbi:uncharacterized protein LOC107022136 [Solanum pennellii]|uniref:Uncharacterized protein LOC107022136 n=1 Tax=Solanum pennellii TaxID=28526 RepID=A0ABM1V1G9_SOLPN|nr:uncharacterized protein LOC107022136 [Solanum pennellii]